MKYGIYIVFVLFVFTSCRYFRRNVGADGMCIPDGTNVHPAMDHILDRNELIALTANNSTSYFIYKGQTMGYEYEMLKNLANYLNVKLTIKLVDNTDSIFVMLNRGDGDLVAYAMAETDERREWVSFTDPFFISQKSLIQKLPRNWREMSQRNIDTCLVRNVLELAGKDVYVRKNSTHYYALRKMNKQLDNAINIVTVDNYTTTEELIDKVVSGDIQFTVADNEVAKNYATYNDSIDFKTPVSMPQKMAWVVRKNSPLLLDTINVWLKHFKKYKSYYYTYDKYFKNSKRIRAISQSSFTSYRDGKLSNYDKLIKQEAERLGWDWRLLAAQIYKESRFRPNEVSWMGAIGLMQILPSTAQMYGDFNLYNPEENITVGVNYLQYLERKFHDLDSINQIKFTLAAYNVGLGHVYDAIRLAKRTGKDTLQWDNNVAEMLLLKREHKYYSLPESRNGYCRGTEPYNYVKEIIERFEDYKRLINE